MARVAGARCTAGPGDLVTAGCRLPVRQGGSRQNRRIGPLDGGEQVLGPRRWDSRIKPSWQRVRQTGSPVTSAWLSAQYGWRGTVQKALNVPGSLCWTCSPEQPAPTTLKESVARIAPRSVLLIAAGNVSDEGYATHDRFGARPDLGWHPARATHKRYRPHRNSGVRRSWASSTRTSADPGQTALQKVQSCKPGVNMPGPTETLPVAVRPRGCRSSRSWVGGAGDRDRLGIFWYLGPILILGLIPVLDLIAGLDRFRTP